MKEYGTVVVDESSGSMAKVEGIFEPPHQQGHPNET